MASSREASNARLPWTVGIVALLALVALALIVQARAGGERIVTASLTFADTIGYQVPPATVPASVLAGGKVVRLPHAPTPLWAPNAESSPQRIATQVTWYHLRV